MRIVALIVNLYLPELARSFEKNLYGDNSDNPFWHGDSFIRNNDYKCSIAFVNFHTGEVKSGVKNPYRGKFTKFRFEQFRKLGLEDNIRIEEIGYTAINYDEYRALILIYNESDLFTEPNLHTALNTVSEECYTRGIPCIHNEMQGMVVGSKPDTHHILSEADILMPRLIEHPDSGLHFINKSESSGAEVAVRNASRAELERKDLYITEYIDTTHTSYERDFYVSIRVLAVGAVNISSFIRTRPVSQSNPSVHNKNTTYDLRVLHDLHNRLITSKRDELNEITRGISNALGFAFLAHDILPCSESGKLYVCETGIKLDDESYRKWLRTFALFHPEKILFSSELMRASYTAFKQQLEI